MINKFGDFFQQVYDRLSSPLIYSFIFSWVIVNWKITIGLIFYSTPELQLDGYVSYIDLISKNSDSGKLLWTPLLLAVLYTFVYPFLRNGIVIFLAWIKSWRSTWQLKVSRGSKVSMERYVRLSQSMGEQSFQLEKLIESESQLRNERDKHMMKASQLEKQLHDASQAEKRLRQLSDIHFFIGSHRMTYWENEGYIERQVNISPGGIFLVDHIHGDRKLFNFDHTGYNVLRNEFFWWIKDEREGYRQRGYVVILRAVNEEMKNFQDNASKSVIKSLSKM